MGLRRDQRLRDPGDFERLRRAGRTYRHPLLLINVASNDLPYNRYGVVTGKRVGGAVVRNRVRRRLRECLRHLDDTLQPGHDVVVVAHAAAAQASSTDLMAALIQTVARAGVYRQPDTL